jgi:hypothetical protein
VELWTSLKIIRKRWYIVVAGLVVLVGLFAMVYKAVKPSYQASGRVVLLQTGQPTGPTSAAVSNPWGSPSDFTALLAQAAGGDSFGRAVTKAGATGSFSVAASIDNTPTLILTTTASTPGAALDSYSVLVRQVEDLALAKQASVHTPSSVLYTAHQNTSPTGTIQLVGSRIKALIFVGAVVILLTLTLVFLVESFSSRASRDEDLTLDEAVRLQIATSRPPVLPIKDQTESGSGNRDEGIDPHGRWDAAGS